MKQKRLDVKGTFCEKSKIESIPDILEMNLCMSTLHKSSNVHDVIFLADEARDDFLDALQNPPKPNRELKKAFKEYKKHVGLV